MITQSSTNNGNAGSFGWSRRGSSFRVMLTTVTLIDGLGLGVAAALGNGVGITDVVLLNAMAGRPHCSPDRER